MLSREVVFQEGSFLLSRQRMAMWGVRFEFLSWSLVFEHVFADTDADARNSASCSVAPSSGFRRFGILTAFKLGFVSRIANCVLSR